MLEGVIPHSRLKEFIARDGTQTFYREWEGSKDGELILYLHGLMSHTGWFIDTGNLLNMQGFHVYAVDRRGSGMSQTERGHMESYWVLINDVGEVIELIRSRHPNKRVYLMGLCWGAKTAVTFAAYHQDMIDGLILFSPAIKTKVNLPLRQKIDVVFSNIVRAHKLFDVPLDNFMFTKNPKYLEFIRKDELKLKKATARFFFETGRMSLRLDRIAHKIHIPALVLLAGDDAIVDNEAVKKWFTKIGSPDKTIKLYHGCCHSLEFEKEIDNIVNYIADWTRKENEGEEGRS